MRLLNFTQFVNENINMQEAVTGLEPVFTPKNDSYFQSFYFAEGETDASRPTLDTGGIDMADIKKWMKSSIEPSIPTIQKFINNTATPLPPIIQFYVATSSSGSADRNAAVAAARMKFLTDIYLGVMKELSISPDIAYKLMAEAPKSYDPSKIDKNFFNTKTLKPKPSERICQIVINPITMMGNRPDQIGNIGGKLIDASSIINTWVGDNVDEKAIVDGIRLLQTYSDITDLNTALINARMGSLESFLNKQLANNDMLELSQIVTMLNIASNRSGKGTIAKKFGLNALTIMLPDSAYTKQLGTGGYDSTLDKLE